MLVTQAGRIVLSAENRAARVRIAEDVTADQVRSAAAALAEALVARTSGVRRRDVLVELIDGERAGLSRWASTFLDAGYRRAGTELRYYANV